VSGPHATLLLSTYVTLTITAFQYAAKAQAATGPVVRDTSTPPKRQLATVVCSACGAEPTAPSVALAQLTHVPGISLPKVFLSKAVDGPTVVVLWPSSLYRCENPLPANAAVER
jgi:hypothetical protein